MAVTRMLLILVLAVVGLILLVRLMESRLVFFPTRSWDLDPASFPPAEVVTFQSSDGVELSGVWLPAPSPVAVLVYCHGNAGNLSHRLPTADLWRQRLGLSVLLFDYRGYGRSGGRPSEEGIYEDTLAAFREAERLGRMVPVVYGRSLGTVPAIRVASSRNAAGLILDSPLTSAREMAHRVLPLPGVGRLTSFRLDNLDTIGRVGCPVLVVHGARDEIIPLAQGRQVFEAAPEPKTFYLLEGGHNDERSAPDLLRTMSEFLEGLKSP